MDTDLDVTPAQSLRQVVYEIKCPHPVLTEDHFMEVTITFPYMAASTPQNVSIKAVHRSHGWQ